MPVHIWYFLGEVVKSITFFHVFNILYVFMRRKICKDVYALIIVIIYLCREPAFGILEEPLQDHLHLSPR